MQRRRSLVRRQMVKEEAVSTRRHVEWHAVCVSGIYRIYYPWPPVSVLSFDIVLVNS